MRLSFCQAVYMLSENQLYEVGDRVNVLQMQYISAIRRRHKAIEGYQVQNAKANHIDMMLTGFMERLFML